MAQLLPDGLPDPDDSAKVAVESAVSFGTSWAWHANGSCACEESEPHLAVVGGKVLTVTGENNLLQWIQHTLSTERGIYQIYSPRYGTEFQQVIRDSVDLTDARSAVVGSVREMLIGDPRIVAVPRVKLSDADGSGDSALLEVDAYSFTHDIVTLEVEVEI